MAEYRQTLKIVNFLSMNMMRICKKSDKLSIV
jgi:hypothetical protein